MSDTVERYILDATVPIEESTAEAVLRWFGRRSFTQKEIVDYITDLSEDKDYGKWEFDQLLSAGFIVPSLK